ncbi:MAG: preprotein translocase subunit YajC [Coriobacteriia bacterium]|nr:preprotein translocase subunit YajC [Coriobacteriia bacterium]
MMLLMFLPMILIIFFLNRSQTKKQRDLESKLKKGDRVITSGGMIGRIADISSNSRYVKLEITSGVKIEVLKTAIQGLDTGDVAAVSSKEASDKGDKGDKGDKNK